MEGEQFHLIWTEVACLKKTKTKHLSTRDEYTYYMQLHAITLYTYYDSGFVRSSPILSLNNPDRYSADGTIMGVQMRRASWTHLVLLKEKKDSRGHFLVL